jgi:hypothetical protein
MNWFWLNVPAMVVFFAAITGIPLWLSFRHTDKSPVLVAVSVETDDAVLSDELEVEPELIAEVERIAEAELAGEPELAGER